MATSTEYEYRSECVGWSESLVHCCKSPTWSMRADQYVCAFDSPKDIMLCREAIQTVDAKPVACTKDEPLLSAARTLHCPWKLVLLLLILSPLVNAQQVRTNNGSLIDPGYITNDGVCKNGTVKWSTMEYFHDSSCKDAVDTVTYCGSPDATPGVGCMPIGAQPASRVWGRLAYARNEKLELYITRNTTCGPTDLFARTFAYFGADSENCIPLYNIDGREGQKIILNGSDALKATHGYDKYGDYKWHVYPQGNWSNETIIRQPSSTAPRTEKDFHLKCTGFEIHSYVPSFTSSIPRMTLDPGGILHEHDTAVTIKPMWSVHADVDSWEVDFEATFGSELSQAEEGGVVHEIYSHNTSFTSISVYAAAMLFHGHFTKCGESHIYQHASVVVPLRGGIYYDTILANSGHMATWYAPQ